ncbi:MAG TPA: PAS domain S-box protein [Roseiarcus sp.]|nr:PAS domain S-box protein [Roseiarcus sp.]
MTRDEADFSLIGRLDSFIENAPTAAAMLDRDMRYMAVSWRWLRDYKIDGPVIGRSHYEVFPDIPERWREAYRRALAGETLSEESDSFERADGTIQWLRWEVRPWRLPDGDVGGIVIFTRDVTAIRVAEREIVEREAHVRSILDTVPDAMIVTDENGLVTSFSAGASELFGYRPEEIVGRNVNILMPEPFRSEHDGYMATYLRTGEAHIIGYGRVVQAVAKDGTILPIDLTVGEARVEGRRIFTGFLRDLTSRQKIEEEYRQSLKMEAVGQLTGGMAHDVNNTLTVIMANLELLVPHLADPDQRELVNEAHSAAKDGAKLAAQLLAFARRQPLNPTSTEIGSLIDNFAGLLGRTLSETIELTIITSRSPALAVVDPAQLQNALLNLALNARDAMPRGGRLTIELSTVRLDADYAQMYPEVRAGRYVLIAVSDTGVGMSQEVRRRAFEPFFTTKPVGAGAGLGLSMVYGFVKQSGGHIQLYSEPGGGTSVRIFLPLDGSEPAKMTETRGPPLRKGSETILLVEDDARLRRVLSRRLRSLGYQIFEAENGGAALAQLAALPKVDLVFTDMVMPGGMTGLELAEAAVAARPGVKVLFTSGYAEPSVARLGQKRGAWLKKPYTADELADKIREVLDGGAA